MEKMEVKPMLVRKIEHFNTHNKNKWNAAFAEVQNVLQLYRATGLPALQNDELGSLFTNTTELLYNKLAGGNAHLFTTEGSIEVDKEAALGIIKKPEGFDELDEAITEYVGNGAKQYNDGYGNIGFAVHDLDKYFRLDDMGDLQFTEAHKAAMEEYGNQYIKTQRGLDVYKFTQDIVAAYFANNMDKHLPRKGKMKIGTLTEYLSNVMQGIDLEKKEVIIEMQGTHGYYADRA